MNTDNTLNKDTLDAIAEIQGLKESSDKKTYCNFSELLDEIKEELKDDKIRQNNLN